jgi:hypothetical protein
MKINSEIRTKVIEKIKTSFFFKFCNVCVSEESWEVNDRIYCIDELNGEMAIPIVSVYCKNCGNIINFNAFYVGALGEDAMVSRDLDARSL